jgi:predicted metal-dependent hydrolase
MVFCQCKLSVYIAIIIVLTAIIYYCINRPELTTIPVRSSFNGGLYNVQKDENNIQTAADMMATIDTRINELIDAMDSKYKNTNNKTIRMVINNLKTRYTNKKLFEISPDNYTDDTSYVLNKEKIALCLRGKKEGAANNIHDYNTLMFVAIHEISHMAIPDTAHTDSFWSTFRFLLLEAHNAGIYTSPKFGSQPSDYCGLDIDYSPMWDSNAPYLDTYKRMFES